MSYRESLTRVLEHSLAHIENLESTAVGPTVSAMTLRERLNRPLGDDGTPAEQVLDDLVRDAAGGIMGNAGGRFFAWVMGGALPAALGADWLAAAWDQNTALHISAPAASMVEEIAGSWIKDVLGLPAGASFAFVTGCQAAHLVGLAAARHAVLERVGWDVERQGLFGAPRVRILTSSERHGTVERSVRMLGLGMDQLHDLPVDEHRCLQPDALERALQAGPDAPAIVILQAGELCTGAYDPFETLIPLAHRYRAWVHVDGAFGLWAAASPRYRHLLNGAAAADSWATDAHKWLNTPFDSGIVVVAHPEVHRQAITYSASYLARHGSARDPIDWTPEWSRRARGFAAYAAMRQLGRKGIAEVVERCCENARRLVLGIGGLPGAEVVWTPTINQGLVRFLDEQPGATSANHDRRTDDVIARIQASGEAYFGGATWQGRRVMRVSCCNFQTTELDVERAIEAARRALEVVVTDVPATA
ncbi:MAG TPA: aminotransferase class V-fold PLP-dependent enzyme [Verrucomicrobiae bacterium]|nr:aminotransferase class V-fold PLP-dependent enzyme [Verrucomicrobiae bacterium]